MGREGKILILLLVIVIGIIMASGNSGKKKIDWRKTYLRKDKIPYGTYVIYNELENLFPNSKIKTVNMSPYMFLHKNDKNGSYIFINDEINSGKEEWNKLKEFVERGNSVFISNNDFIMDSLGFRTHFITSGFAYSDPVVSLVNPVFKDKKYVVKKNRFLKVFEKIDTLNTTVLGELSYISDSGKVVKKGANFVKFDYGKGHFYFHTTPVTFTNYFILDSINSEYTAGVLSYLESPGILYWDGYYKNGKQRIQSPLHYIFNNSSLRWAYYMLLLGVLIFIIFEGRRKQRSIKVLKPNRNMTLQFTRTIANMYYENSNHKKIADMKIDFLMEFIRSKFLLDTQNQDDVFIRNLALKSHSSESEIKKMINVFDKIKSKSVVTKEELADLEKIIENFKQLLR